MLFFLYSTSYDRIKRDLRGTKLKDSFGNYVKEDIFTKPIFRTYYVFNANQLNNCPKFKINEVSEDADLNKANVIMEKIPVSVEFDINDEAYYDPKRDEIFMPPKKNFYRVESFYSTLFHEAIHSTRCSKST